MRPRRSIHIGYDGREHDAYIVACRSLMRHSPDAILDSRRIADRTIDTIHIKPIRLSAVRHSGQYWRSHRRINGQLWDEISQAPMSTEFAISRFLTPHLSDATEWAMFADCDIMARCDIARLFDLADERFAVMCVKHAPVAAAKSKMDGQAQLAYARKCWSSVMLFNMAHPAIRALSLTAVNYRTGRWLHGLQWIDDSLIGELPLAWNWMPGVSPAVRDPALVHFTMGVPSMSGWEKQPFADEWKDYADIIP